MHDLDRNGTGLDRRAFLRAAAALAGGALSGACSRATEQLAEDGARSPSESLLDDAQRARMTRAIDLILPTTDTPGALDAGVPDFVEMMLVDYYHEDERRVVLDGLDALDARSRERGAASFVDAPEDLQVAILADLEKAGLAQLQAGVGGPVALGLGGAGGPAPPAAFFQALRELVAVGFCTSELAGESIFQYDPWPGRHDGCVPIDASTRPYVS